MNLNPDPRLAAIAEFFGSRRSMRTGKPVVVELKGLGAARLK
jgi:hypothetical protein